jgi:hypothetical protein
MKRPVAWVVPMVVASLVGGAGVAAAGTPTSLRPFLDYGDYYDYDAATKEWKFTATSVGCDSYVKEAQADGVADSLVVDVPYDTPDFSKGPHTFKELRTYCDRAKRAEAIYKWLGWALTATTDSAGDLAVACTEFYDKTVKKYGFAPTTKIPYEGVTIEDPATGQPYVGTLEGARKAYCDVKASKYQAAVSADEAPYRKVLKADKLRVALENMGKAIYLPGRVEGKPSKLAAGKVWFRLVWYDDRKCKDGVDVVHVLQRYQFDGRHALVSQTEKNFCGAPPKAAYR